MTEPVDLFSTLPSLPSPAGTEHRTLAYSGQWSCGQEERRVIRVTWEGRAPPPHLRMSKWRIDKDNGRDY